MTLLQIGIILFIVFFLGPALIVRWLMAHAGTGYEDDDGYHQVKP